VARFSVGREFSEDESSSDDEGEHEEAGSAEVTEEVEQLNGDDIEELDGHHEVQSAVAHEAVKP